MFRIGEFSRLSRVSVKTPASTLVVVKRLVREEYLVEVEAIAVAHE